MIKRILCLLFVLALLPVLPAVAEETSADILTLEELLQWAESYKLRALESTPINDPYAEESYTDDGYEFIYDFVTLYMDGPELTADSVVQGLVVTSEEEEGLRGVRVWDTAQDVLNAYYTENPDLVGNREQALIYAVDLMPGGGYIAMLHRDGQRIQVIDYVVHEQAATGADGYTDAGLIYTIQDNNVLAIRAYGLDSRFLDGDVSMALENAREIAAENTYSMVFSSYVGSELEPFDTEDMRFSGIDFPSLTPEDAITVLGEPQEDVWLDNDGSYLRTMQFVSCEITFAYDGAQQNPRVRNMLIDTDLLEGPRSVRVGDTVASVLNRFRNGEGESDGFREVLYGDEATDSYGVAEYGVGVSAVLRYGATSQDGVPVVMYLNFEQLYLKEILLLVNE